MCTGCVFLLNITTRNLLVQFEHLTLINHTAVVWLLWVIVTMDLLIYSCNYAKFVTFDGVLEFSLSLFHPGNPLLVTTKSLK